MMDLSFYNNGHKETYKNPLIDEILEVDLCKGLLSIVLFLENCATMEKMDVF